MSRLADYFSYFWGIKVRKVRSALNGKLEVWYISGRYQLDARNVNYSFGSLHRLFQKVFSEINLTEINPPRLLLLGMGGGSVISIIRDELRLATQITAIDHDPDILALAKEYFRIDRYSGLDIVCRDALEFVQEGTGKYDVIVIDLFHDQTVPEKFHSGLFLESCEKMLNPGGILVFNFIVKTWKEQKEFDQVVEIFRTMPGKTNILEAFGTNKVLLFRSGLPEGK